jgi:hypothetical protein
MIYMPKALIPRRINDTKDYFGFPDTAGGLYCVTPYNINREGLGLFKIGLTTSFHRRIDQYNVVVPTALWVIALLKPDMRHIRDDTAVAGRTRRTADDGLSTYQKKHKYLRTLEDELIRILNSLPNVVNYQTHINVKGRSEWFFCTVKDMHRAFDILASRLRNPTLRKRTITHQDGEEWNEREKRLFKRFLEVRTLIGVWKAGERYPTEPANKRQQDTRPSGYDTRSKRRRTQ